MALHRFGFIVAGPGFDPAVHRHTLASPSFTMLTIGVADPSQGPAAARELVAAGAQLIELCGAFGPAATAAVQQAVDRAVPVGAVSYAGDAVAGLHALFSS